MRGNGFDNRSGFHRVVLLWIPGVVVQRQERESFATIKRMGERIIPPFVFFWIFSLKSLFVLSIPFYRVV